jgi:hypothetical protein
MSDERDPRPARSTDPDEGTASTGSTDAVADPVGTADVVGGAPTPSASAEEAAASESIAAAAGVDGLPAAESDPAIEADATAAIAAPAAPADAAAEVPAIRPARRLALAVAAGLGRLLRFAFVVALFAGGLTLGYQAHLATSVGSAGPVADPATAGNQPAPVIRELIAAVESNDADRIRSVVPSEPYKLFTSEMQNWSFQEVTSVETLATFEDGTRTATAFVMIGRSAQGNPVTINLVAETEGGNIVDFK